MTGLFSFISCQEFSYFIATSYVRVTICLFHGWNSSWLRFWKVMLSEDFLKSGMIILQLFWYFQPQRARDFEEVSERKFCTKKACVWGKKSHWKMPINSRRGNIICLVNVFFYLSLESVVLYCRWMVTLPWMAVTLH